MSAAAAQEATPPEQAEPAFSLTLTQDQKDIRDWVHGFAEGVVRPAAHEWDEREETPWPIIAEAARIGLYGLDALAQFYADPAGLLLPIVLFAILRLVNNRELMGTKVNGPIYNLAAWLTAILVTVISLLYLLMTFFPGLVRL